MKENNKNFYALEALVIVSSALKKAGLGKLSICSIREGLSLLHNHNEEFSKEKGAFIFSKFDFGFSSIQSHELSMRNFLKDSIQLAEENNQMSNKISEQICFIISDGIFNKDFVKPLCVEAKEKGILYVFIILNEQSEEDERLNNKSITKMSSVKQIIDKNGETDFEIKPYLDDFPFEHFVVLEKSSDMPEVMNEILIKWMNMKTEG